MPETALAYAVPLAKALNSRVVLLHAESDPYADMFGGDRAERIYQPTGQKDRAQRHQTIWKVCATVFKPKACDATHIPNMARQPP